jgi:hypothetical protein
MSDAELVAGLRQAWHVLTRMQQMQPAAAVQAAIDRLTP